MNLALRIVYMEFKLINELNKENFLIDIREFYLFSP